VPAPVVPGLSPPAQQVPFPNAIALAWVELID